MKRIILVALVFALLAACETGPTQPTAANYGGSSPAETLAALKNDAAVEFAEVQDWTSAKVEQTNGRKIWWFPPANHPANPAMIIQVISEEESGTTRTKANAVCSVSQEVCQNLLNEFNAKRGSGL